MYRSWGLPVPKCFVVIIGDLDVIQPDQQCAGRIESLLFHGVCKFASDRGGWILCSGQQHFIELLLGRAISDTTTPPPIMGVCSFESLKKKTERASYNPNKFTGSCPQWLFINITYWGLLRFTYWYSFLFLTFSLRYPCCCFRAEKQPGSGPGANVVSFNQSISHLLLLRGDKWDGDDADALVLNTFSEWCNHSIPLFVLLIGGGAEAVPHLITAIDQDIPVFALQGTGTTFR